MGGTQSTRSVTVSNENENNVIRVSDNVVRRLRGESQAAQAAKADSNPGRGSGPESSGQTVIQSAYIPGYNPISSVQVRREVQNAKDEADKYWQRRVTTLVEGQERSKQVMEGEFKKALNEVQVAFKGYNTERYENPCTGTEASLTKCYNDNPSRPLNCAAEVRAFSQCVQVKHNNVMKART